MNHAEKARSRRAIEEQWEFIKDYLDEYVSLCEHLGLVMPQDIIEIATTVDFSFPAVPSS